MKTVHPTDTKSWFVYGPQGCGKTHNAKALADALNLNHIRDDWTPDQKIPITDHLILTQHEPQDFGVERRRVLSFNEAMKRIHPQH
ncbi:MAG TPA: hypothetical protein VGC62_16250 [Pseudomonas sp.]|uniref:ATP-binding protein n=1 Tax=Pseudomonas sp. TaxID=306 RepID=UPI002ED9303A